VDIEGLLIRPPSRKKSRIPLRCCGMITSAEVLRRWSGGKSAARLWF